jgi:hypothetical protein
MIKAATRDSPLFKLPPVVDPSNEIAEVLVKALEWNMLSREWNLTVSDLEDLHGQSKALLEALKECLPDRIGGAKGWCFEKAHSILHKVREIIMWGWSENTSCQGPEHAHIDLIKNVAHLTNNKDVFLCILRYHCRRGFVQQYEQMLEDMLDQGDSQPAGASQVSRKVQWISTAFYCGVVLQTQRATTYTPLTPWSLSRTCTTESCVLVATLLIWMTTVFTERISRWFR